MDRVLDRHDTGGQLGARLRRRSFHRPLVLALPRGGVPVAFEVAAALDAPLDVFVSRKIGAPGHPEYGIGALAEGNTVVYDPRALTSLRISQARFETMVSAERTEADRRVALYRHGRELPHLDDRDVILVDDGLATGVTAEAALRALRDRNPRRLVLAVPACAADTAVRLRSVADEVVSLIAAHDFSAVGRWYVDFDQTNDDEVLRPLEQARHRPDLADQKSPLC